MTPRTLAVGAPFVFEGIPCTISAIGGKNPNALTVTPDEAAPFDVRTFVIAEVEWLDAYEAFGVPSRAAPRPHAGAAPLVSGFTKQEG